MQLEIHEINSHRVYCRPDTPDLKVAKDSLGDEFDILIELLRAIEHPFLILDFGGYIGTAAIKFASINNSQIVSYEPSPENFKVLTLNTLLHPNIMALDYP